MDMLFHQVPSPGPHDQGCRVAAHLVGLVRRPVFCGPDVVAGSDRLRILDADGRTGITGKDTGPLDMVVSSDGRNLYTLNGRSDTIGVFAIKDKGGLASMNSHVTVPATANGLAIR